MNTHKTRIAAAYRQLTGERLKGRISAIEDMASTLYATVRTPEGTYKTACVYGRPFTTPQWVLKLVVPIDYATMDAWEQYERDSY